MSVKTVIVSYFVVEYKFIVVFKFLSHIIYLSIKVYDKNSSVNVCLAPNHCQCLEQSGGGPVFISPEVI